MKLLKSLLAAAVVAGGLGGVAMAQDKIVIGVSVPAADHGWTGGVNYFAQQAIDRLKTTYPNVEFVFASAPDAPKQIADIEDMVATRDIDALVILPGDPDAMTSAIKQVKDAGKFVTVVDRQLSIAGVENLYVAGDNPGLGANSAAYFKEALPDGGNIVILRGLPIPIDQQRFDGFMGGIEGTQIKVLDDEFANWNRDDGFKVMQDFLTRFPDIKGVWAQDDDIALGAIEAIKQAGRENDMFIVGGDDRYGHRADHVAPRRWHPGRGPLCARLDPDHQGQRRKLPRRVEPVLIVSIDHECEGRLLGALCFCWITMSPKTGSSPSGLTRGLSTTPAAQSV